MYRRQYLTSAGTGLALGVAGCTSSGPEDTDESEDIDEFDGTNESDDTNESEDTADLEGGDADSDAATEEGETPSSEATNALENAGEQLNEAIDIMIEETDTAWAYYSTDASISTGGIEVALENANTSIEEADAAATTDAQRGRVEEFEILTEFIGQLLDTAISLGEGLNQVSTALSYKKNNRYEDAAEYYTNAKASFEAANKRLDQAKTTFGKIGEDMDTNIDYARSEDAQSELDELVSGYVLSTEADIPYAKGLADYTTGYDRFEEEDVRSEWAFEDAIEHFKRAESLYRESERKVAQSFRDTFITQTCRTGKRIEMSELMLEASKSLNAEEYAEARRKEEQKNAISVEECG